MSDIALKINGNTIDFEFENSDLVCSNGLKNVILMALIWNREWVGNYDSNSKQNYGSTFEEIYSHGISDDTVKNAKELVKSALSFIKDEGIASDYDVSVAANSNGNGLIVTVTLYQGSQSEQLEYDLNWRDLENNQ